MYGHYLHAITSHCSTQYELASLRALNTENQERLFGQARGIAEACTNHHADNVIPQILLRLQVKQEQHVALASVQKGDTQVSRVAKELPEVLRTHVQLSFIQLPTFLVTGTNVWWSYTDKGFLFHDGDADPSNPDDTFTLLHFRSHSLTDVEERQAACWKKIVEERVVIPANSIKLYDNQGNKTGRLLYSNHMVTLEHVDSLERAAADSLDNTDTSSPLITSALASSLPDVSTGNQDNVNESLIATHKMIDTPPEDGDRSAATESRASSRISVPAPTPEEVICRTSVPAPTSEEVICTPSINFGLEKKSEELKTSVATSLTRLMGRHDELDEFDELRFRLKEAKKARQHISSVDTSRYRQLEAKLGTRVLSIRSRLDKELKEFEYKHFEKYSKLPT